MLKNYLKNQTLFKTKTLGFNNVKNKVNKQNSFIQSIMVSNQDTILNAKIRIKGRSNMPSTLLIINTTKT